PAVFATAGLALLFTGTGRVSIDHLLGIDDLAGLRESVLLLAVVLAGVAATLVRRRAQLRSAAVRSAEQR
ncbi:hypothetical protein G3I24_20680, partial [Micromonospora aurantiaca]|nr:hypothetical protein [Micromonospora aurantiaca]